MFRSQVFIPRSTAPIRIQADLIGIEEGHLVFSKDSEDEEGSDFGVAIFAPGSWLYFIMDPDDDTEDQIDPFER